MSILIAMSLICIAWFALGIILVGAGLGVVKLRERSDNIFIAFWFGLALFILLLQIWHFFLPISMWAFAPVLLLAAYGLHRQRAELAQILRRACKYDFTIVFIFLALCLWTANIAAGRPKLKDTASYHLTAVRWATEYKATPGLVNLHSRLAYNNSSFLYNAALESETIPSNHLSNGLLFLFLAGHCLLGLRRTLARRGKIADVFLAVLFFPVMTLLVSGYISSLSPDFPIYAIGIVVTLMLLRMLVEKTFREENFFLLTMLVCLGVTIKLSFGIFGLTAIVIGLMISYASTDSFRRWLLISLVCPAICGSFLIIPWLAHSVIKSGYPLYPSTVGAFDVEWKQRPERAKAEYDQIIRFFAQRKGLLTREAVRRNNDWQWVTPWAKRITMTPRYWHRCVFPLILFIISMAFIFLLRRKAINRILIAMLPALATIPFWFLSAPDPRFAGASFWILGAISLCVLFSRGFSEDSDPHVSCFPVGIFAITLAFGFFATFTYRNGIPYNTSERAIWRYSEREFGHSLTTDSLGFHTTPVPKLKLFITDSGLKINIPIQRRPGYGLCWNMPLPCTPFPNSKLKLRTPGDLGGGFILDESGE